MNPRASSVRKLRASAAVAVKLFLQLLLAILFFLSPRSDGLVAHPFRKHPITHSRISHPYSSSSATSIGSDDGQSIINSRDVKGNDAEGSTGETTTTTTTTTTIQSDTHSIWNPKKKIPVHLFAGFLGSGKTTTLKHVLENKEDVRVGIIVNDVASVNIDAKLIARHETQQQQLEGGGTKQAGGSEGAVVELQNGCACCSLAGELFDSIESLLQHTENNVAGSDSGDGAIPYDAILVELSGVADPQAIQNNWKEAIQQESNTFVTESSELGTVVTIVDATTFGSDYMSFDILKDRDGWFENNAKTTNSDQKKPHSVNRQVVELLAEQVEAADLIVINKEDLAGPEKVEITKAMAQSLNEDARVLVTSHGKLPTKELLGMPHSRVHDCDDDFDVADDSSHSHSYDHDLSDFEDESSSNSHAHSHSHSHSHSQDHTACDDPDCTDVSHSHTISQDHTKCDDDHCTDPSHDHTNDQITSTANLGISSFVYKATRPFEPNRLRKIIFDWPIPIKEELDFALLNDTLKTGYGIDAVAAANETPSKPTKQDEATDRGSDKPIDNTLTSNAAPIIPFVGVLRSKGFCWIAPTAWEGLLADTWRHDTAMYWSHAGKHFGIQPGGRFWDSLPRPALEDFFGAIADPEAAIEKILKEDFVTEEFGDRRQELVFIGVRLRQHDIENALDGCLLTDAEMEDYRQQLLLLKKS